MNKKSHTFPLHRLTAAIAVLSSLPAVHAATLTVNTTTDIGGAGCELREAIVSVNAGANQGGCEAVGTYGVDDQILITSTVTGTITLNGSELLITEDVSIQGPGASNLAISGNGTSRVINAQGVPDAPVNVTIDGLTITDGMVSGTTASQWGAGIITINTNLKLRNSSLRDNYADGIGGAVGSISSSISLENTAITGNTASLAGGIIALSSPLTISNSTISGNSATNGAGAILTAYSDLTIQNSTIRGNTESGVGIYGALYLYGSASVTIRNTTIASNSGGRFSGLVAQDSSVTLVNSTVSDNSGTLFSGLGVVNSTLNIINSTLTNNLAPDSSGIFLYDSTATLSNSIITGNSSGDCMLEGASHVQAGHSIISDVGAQNCGITADAGNLIGADPRLGPLADNGCTTQSGVPGSASCVATRALSTNSPAVGSADVSLCRSAPVNSVDERGYPRGPYRCDMGAFEVSDDPLPQPIPLVPFWGLLGLAGLFGSLGGWIQRRSGKAITKSP